MHKFFVLISTLLVVLLCTVSISFAKMVSVSGTDVNLRSGPGTNYKIKWKYGSGFPLRVLSQKGNWLKVEDFEADVGWLHKSLTSGTGHLIVKVNKGKNKKVNIRSGPGTKYKVVGKAYYGVVFRTIKQQRGWAKVKHESGVEGWVKRSLLWGF
ncbi:MAG: peptide-binding protein [Desulfobulbaceae bacterium]|nr:MAG: peptide-binding protein [Desulfobulbaceae bacterium]